MNVHVPNIAEVKCPICKKIFIPAVEHQWLIRKAGCYKKVCSYSCMRKWEKPRLEAEKKKKIKELSEGEQNTCALCADYNMGDCDNCELNLKKG